MKLSGKLKKIATVMATIVLLGATGITSYARDDRWERSEETSYDGVHEKWRVRRLDGHGYLENMWYQDETNGNWYVLGYKGYMLTGVVFDDEGSVWLFDNEPGENYGRMILEDGTYTFFGGTVKLAFNHSSNGKYGEIIKGAEELVNMDNEMTLPFVSAGKIKPYCEPRVMTEEEKAELNDWWNTHTQQSVYKDNTLFKEIVESVKENLAVADFTEDKLRIETTAKYQTNAQNRAVRNEVGKLLKTYCDEKMGHNCSTYISEMMATIFLNDDHFVAVYDVNLKE
jgi:hypothetical protein